MEEDKIDFGKMISDDFKRVGKVDEDGNISLQGINDNIKIGKINKGQLLVENPNILEEINNEFNKFIVDEEQTRKAIFICACGSFVKNLSSTFNVFVNGESSAGKSWVVKNVLKIFPEEIFSKETYRTKISPNAFTYWHNSNVEPDWTWNGKILYLEDVGNNILNCDVFKVMISEGSTATIVGRKKGQGYELPATFDIEITGKPITFITTAMGTPIEEIKNRFLMIDLDESEEQTQRIMEMQTALAISGEKKSYSNEVKDALCLLKRVDVLLPEWANHIKNFIKRKDVLRWRREFPRFLEIIKCSAALHQFQRTKDDKGRIIADEKDYEIARQIIGKINASSGVEGLTHREKRACEIIKEFYRENEKGCTKAEIYAYKPIYSDRGWERILDKLANKGLLSIRLDVNPETNRKAAHFFPVEIVNLSLPEFKSLTDINEQIDNTYVLYNTKEKEKSKNSVLHNSNAIMSITSFSIMVLKDGEPFNLTIEEGQNYPISYFGDNPDETIKLLEQEGKILLNE